MAKSSMVVDAVQEQSPTSEHEGHESLIDTNNSMVADYMLLFGISNLEEEGENMQVVSDGVCFPEDADGGTHDEYGDEDADEGAHDKDDEVLEYENNKDSFPEDADEGADDEIGVNKDGEGVYHESDEETCDEGSDTKNSLKMSKSVRLYLRRRVRMSRDRMNKKIATAKLITQMFNKDLKNNEFLVWFSNELNFKTVDTFEKFLCYADVDAPVRGRKIKVTEDQAHCIHNFWKENSIISVDRRNNRNVVKVYPEKINKLVRNVEDDSIKVFTTVKGREKLQGDRHIYTKTVRELYREFVLKFGDKVCKTTFFSLKPFYIGEPTTREMESCTCILCVNPHYLYNSFKQNLKKATGKILPNSLTEYLTLHFKCTRNNDFDYYETECIMSTCNNQYKIRLDRVADDQKLHTYIQFKDTITTYYNKHGKKVEYTRCARTEEKASLKGMQAKLLDIAPAYLMHCFYVSVDKAFWARFRSVCPSPILHIVYSENIKLTPKNEVQTSHFSGRQHTLHCCVLYKSNSKGDHKFLYHFSDDTNHDSIMTSSILQDIIERYPSIIESGTLVIRSDNCSMQYKSRFVFAQMEKIAKTNKINVFWFYGAPGHGRGLVDAMSSFGCKAPMKTAIITEDKFFMDATEMCNFLVDHFTDDSKSKKSYFIIDEKHTAGKCKRKSRPEHRIVGSSKMHLIAVSSTGDWLTKVILLPTDEKIMELQFDRDCDEVYLSDEEWEEDDEHPFEDGIEEDVIQDYPVDVDIKFDFITEGSYVALPTHASGFEQFYLVKVLEKGVAEKNITDQQGHSISLGQMYIKGSYFEKVSENRKQVFYKKAKNIDNVLINLNEISSINVDFDGKVMTKEEYVSICQDIFWLVISLCKGHSDYKFYILLYPG